MPRAQDAILADRKTAAASIDAYYEANLLTGEASQPSLDELTKKALKIKDDGDRLFVHWTSPGAAVECQAIGPVCSNCLACVTFSMSSWQFCMLLRGYPILHVLRFQPLSHVRLRQRAASAATRGHRTRGTRPAAKSADAASKAAAARASITCPAEALLTSNARAASTGTRSTARPTGGQRRVRTRAAAAAASNQTGVAAHAARASTATI